MNNVLDFVAFKKKRVDSLSKVKLKVKKIDVSLSLGKIRSLADEARILLAESSK